MNLLNRILFLTLLTLLAFYLFPLQASASESLYFVHQDHLGSTSMVTDESGEVVYKQVYYPYGSTRNYQSTISNEQLTISHQYTSQVSDQKQTNLYYYNARYYRPKTAIFTQSDTLEGPNRYVYVNGNPIVRVDDSGNQCSGIGCQRKEEPVDLLKLRLKTASSYDIQIKSYNPGDYYPNFSSYPVHVQEILREEYPEYFQYSYFEQRELEQIKQGLEFINSDIYKGAVIYPIYNFKFMGQNTEDAVFLGLKPQRQWYRKSLPYTVVHDLVHYAQDNNPDKYFIPFIELANKTGFYKANIDFSSRKLLDDEFAFKNLSSEEKKGYAIYHADKDLWNKLGINDFRRTNWAEFQAFMVTDILAGYHVEEYQKLFPDLVQWINDNILVNSNLKSL